MYVLIKIYLCVYVYGDLRICGYRWSWWNRQL